MTRFRGRSFWRIWLAVKEDSRFRGNDNRALRAGQPKTVDFQSSQPIVINESFTDLMQLRE
jgi:hypothetical protein